MDLIKIFCLLLISFQLNRAALKYRKPRLSLMDTVSSYFVSNVDGHPGSYSFGYDVADPSTGNNQYRTEERYPNGTVVGSYGYVDPRGKPHRFRYIADERGYRVSRLRQSTPSYQPPFSRGTTEPSITWTRPKKKPNKKVVNSINTNNIQGPGNFFYSQKKPTAYRLY